MAATTFSYLHGFGNEHESEALPGALPMGRFNPQRVRYGLYTEQISNTAFTAPRANNRRTWLYRILPSVAQGDYRPLAETLWETAPIADAPLPPAPLRWDPLPAPAAATDFVAGMITMAAAGNASLQQGMGAHIYSANASMTKRHFVNADGELLLVPQSGCLLLRTECGPLLVAPGSIALIPRGIRFRVELPDSSAYGYACENYGQPLTLPERGPVGANGYANDRDFQYPTATYEDERGEFELITKFGGRLYSCPLDHSPLDVVAWTGNSAPWRYDLGRFNVIGTVSYDHPDPSIYTVLTSPSAIPGTANLDFVIFPPRWMVAEDTFRPPWYHRNVMNEFMGLIQGVYDAKETGFAPGGASLHNCMTPHGPDAAAFEQASTVKLQPQRYEDTLALMFESRYPLQTSSWAWESDCRQRDYRLCWNGLHSHFQTPEEA